jgi:hypothetical protein
VTPNSPALVATDRRRGGWVILVGVVVAVTSALALFACVELALTRAMEPMIEMGSGPALDTPFDRTVSLRASDYVLYERTSTPTLTPDSFAVTGPDGASVPVGGPGAMETADLDGVVYTAVAGFPAATGGSYRITSRAPAGRQVIVNRSLGSGVRGLRPWVLGAVGSAAGGMIGLFVLLVGLAIRFAGPPPK